MSVTTITPRKACSDLGGGTGVAGVVAAGGGVVAAGGGVVVEVPEAGVPVAGLPVEVEGGRVVEVDGGRVPAGGWVPSPAAGGGTTSLEGCSVSPWGGLGLKRLERSQEARRRTRTAPRIRTAVFFMDRLPSRTEPYASTARRTRQRGPRRGEK
jgi:hypothetical protein